MNMKKIGIFALLAVVLVGAVFAGVVMYLSNTSTANVDVSTPMVTSINGADSVDISVYGGEKIELNTLVENKANVAIDVYKATLEVTSDDEWTGTEFSAVELTDRGTYVGDLLGFGVLCHVRPDGSSINFASIAGEHTKVAKIMVCSDGSNVDAKYTQSAGSIIDNKIEITTNPALVGAYKVEFCHLNDLTGDC